MEPLDVDALIASAGLAMAQAQAGFSGFHVGAAIMAEDGGVYTGCNIENPSLMLTICAERVALYKALSEGRRAFRAMALVCDEGRYCFPCGVCRQLLFEYAPQMPIYLNATSGVKKYLVSELLPHPFER